MVTPAMEMDMIAKVGEEEIGIFAHVRAYSVFI